VEWGQAVPSGGHFPGGERNAGPCRDRADNEEKMNAFAALEKWPRPLALVVGLGAVAAIGALDIITAPELAFSTFYLIPIFLLTWTLGRAGGLAGALASTALRTIDDVLGGIHYSNHGYFYGNAALRLCLFVAMALVLVALRQLVDHERSLAATDFLTGAANTRSFRETLQMEIARSRRYGRPFALAYFDLDNFKTINDTLGHAAGDAVLKGVVSSLRAHVRHMDTVGRLGGDEFALLLPETDHDQAIAAVSKTRQGLLKELERKGWNVTVSIGVFTTANPDMAAADVIHRADELMYAAKVSGKNQIRWD
jgi:diguanylate cyclase (GGDEF)-like protein